MVWVAITGITEADKEELESLKQDISNTLCTVVTERRNGRKLDRLVLEVATSDQEQDQKRARRVIREIAEGFGFKVEDPTFRTKSVFERPPTKWCTKRHLMV
jgi:hypothetical protein